jgi:hypothetical protein
MLAGMAAASPAGLQVARPAYWFPLALFGVIVALSVPLYALQLSTAPMASGWAAYAPLTRTVFWSSAHSSFSALLYPDGGPLGIAAGWYWAAALARPSSYRAGSVASPGPAEPTARRGTGSRW